MMSPATVRAAAAALIPSNRPSAIPAVPLITTRAAVEGHRPSSNGHANDDDVPVFAIVCPFVV